MSILKRAGDLVYTFRFLKLLVTPFEDTEAFKLGIIDNAGKRDKSVRITTAEQKSAYTPFHRLVFNIKKLLAVAPGGSSRIASYAAALYLLKEKYSVSESQLEKAIKEYGLDITDFMAEQTGWFVLEDSRLSPGTYRVTTEKLLNSTLDEMVSPKDQIRVGADCYPVGNLFGLNIYEVTHVKTNQPVYVTVSELAI